MLNLSCKSIFLTELKNNRRVKFMLISVFTLRRIFVKISRRKTARYLECRVCKFIFFLHFALRYFHILNYTFHFLSSEARKEKTKNARNIFLSSIFCKIWGKNTIYTYIFVFKVLYIFCLHSRL